MATTNRARPSWTMRPPVRKLVLTTHVGTSVGWPGAVTVFIALAAIGFTSPDIQIVRSVLLLMEPAAWYVLVPLALTSLLTGIIQSLGTAWGLFHHWWVIIKLLIAVVATIILVIYMSTFNQMALIAADSTSTNAALRSFAGSALLHGVVAWFALQVAVGLSIYKPRGVTRYGYRKQTQNHPRSTATEKSQTQQQG